VDELAEYLDKQHEQMALYPGDFSHFIASIYISLQGALRRDATSITLNHSGFVYRQGNRVKHRFPFPRRFMEKDAYQELVQVHFDAFHKVLERDAIIKKYLRIVADTSDELTCEFIRE
jgi:hypothetical protein